MQEAQNTRVVQDAYAAFGRSDIQALLDSLDDNISWKPLYGSGSHVPTAGERHGKAAVGEFFTILSQSTTFQRFEPQEFIAQGDKVVVLGHYTATASTGRSFDSDWVMIFTLQNGKIAAFREFSDSAAVNAAF